DRAIHPLPGGRGDVDGGDRALRAAAGVDAVRVVADDVQPRRLCIAEAVAAGDFLGGGVLYAGGKCESCAGTRAGRVFAVGDGNRLWRGAGVGGGNSLLETGEAR